MFKNKECVGHMVGGAVIGVAVGMLMQKMLSPRSEKQTVDAANKDHPMCRENVKRRSRNNLQVPLHHHKNRSHSHQCRSKSACCSKHFSYLSTNSQQKSKLSASESDLRSNSAERSDKTRKSEASTKPMTSDEKSTEHFFNTSTEYLIYESKVPRNSSGNIAKACNWNSRDEASTTMSTEYAPFVSKEKFKNTELKAPISDIDNRKSDNTEKFESNVASWEIKEKALKSNIETMSTEYLMLPELKKHRETSKQSLLSDMIDCTKASSLASDETANWSINATCDTANEVLSIDSNSKEFVKTTETELLEGLDNEGFVTIPTVYESSSLATGYIENKSK